MIRNEAAYQRALSKLDEAKERLRRRRARLARLGLASVDNDTSVQLLRTEVAELQHRIATYERLRNGDEGALVNFHGLGKRLVALRIACGVTQQELARRLGVHRSQVSRDERTDYQGITVERAARVLDALGVYMKTSFAAPRGRPRVAASHGQHAAARRRA